jgi:hypothetical protein
MQPQVPQWILEILKILLSILLGTFGLELWRKYNRKVRESAEISNIYREGDQLNINVRANIDKYVEEKTAAFKAQISELEKTIVQISSKYRSDLERYMQRISDLERKFDEQIKRTQQVEDDLTRETDDRRKCYDLLRSVQLKLNQLESGKSS